MTCARLLALLLVGLSLTACSEDSGKESEEAKASGELTFTRGDGSTFVVEEGEMQCEDEDFGTYLDIELGPADMGAYLAYIEDDLQLVLPQEMGTNEEEKVRFSVDDGGSFPLGPYPSSDYPLVVEFTDATCDHVTLEVEGAVGEFGGDDMIVKGTITLVD